MPLSQPSKRESIHTRNIRVTSFRRPDDQWDIEGHLLDTAELPIENTFRGIIKKGQPIHDMHFRLTLNLEIKITEVEASMDDTPYAMCPAIEKVFQKLVGETIGPGWNRRIRDLFGGVLGCVHMVDLLSPIGTVGFKTVKREAGLNKKANSELTDNASYQINTCHAMASDSEIVKERWPLLYTGYKNFDSENST